MPLLKGRLPQMVVFDLDYTLWDLWVDTHVVPPLKRRGNELNAVYDKHGTKLEFYTDVPALLVDLNVAGVHVAAASRTHAPKAARQALSELLLPSSPSSSSSSRSKTSLNTSPKREDVVPSMNLFKTLEIYPGSKIAHMKAIHDATKIPYEEMVFFDDEPRNMEVTRLGVTFVLVRNGVSRKAFNEGIQEWRKFHGHDDDDDDTGQEEE